MDGYHQAGARGVFEPERARLRARGEGHGRQEPANHLPAHPAQRHGARAGGRHLGRRLGRAGGVGAVLPGHRGAAAHAQLGQHPHPRPEHARRGVVALALPGHGHPDHSAGLQPAG